ncbi:hypothetical protein ACUC2M_13820 [Bacillus cytotoxicus]
MRSFGSIVTSTICSIILVIWNILTFYNKYTTGDKYAWISGILAVLFLAFLINNAKDIIKKNYITSMNQ